MKRRLCFVDDDQAEIDAIRPLVEPVFNVEGRSWPFDKPLRDVIGKAPDIFVLDLYLPDPKGAIQEDIPEEEIAAQRALAERVSHGFSTLYAKYERNGGKNLLRQTMARLTSGRQLLDAQWTALRQSPKHGVELMKGLRRLYGEVPIVFDSRKITPADVTDVLRAGAFDAIQKDSLTGKELCARLRSDINLFKSPKARQARNRGLRVNVTTSRPRH